MIRLAERATISRFGDRVWAQGCEVHRAGVGVYQLILMGIASEEADKKIHVFAHPTTPERVTTVEKGPPGVWYVFTYGLADGFDPGSDLEIRVFRDVEGMGDGFLLQSKGADEEVTLPPAHQGPFNVMVQPHAATFRMPVVKQHGDKLRIQTLITRTPPTPLETNTEIAVVRNLGPIRSSNPGA